MKWNRVFTGLLLLVSLSSFSQQAKEDSLLRYYAQYPQQAQQEAARMLEKARKTNNGPLRLRAIFLECQSSLRIDEELYPTVIARLEEDIRKEKDRLIHSLLYSYTAGVYTVYYQNNSDKIIQRKPIVGSYPEDIREWSDLQFTEKIRSYAQKAVKEDKALQVDITPEYEPILIPGKEPCNVHPTLYDVLVRNSINQLEEIGGYTCNTVPQRDSLWKALLRFRQEAGDKENLILVELEYLDHQMRKPDIENRDSLYIIKIDSLAKLYGDHPCSVEISHKQATLYQGYSRNKQEEANKQKALAICCKGIEKYPNNPRIGILREKIKELLAPDLEVRFQANVYPGEKQKMTIRFENTPLVEINIYKLDGPTSLYLNRSATHRDSFHRIRIDHQVVNLPNRMIRLEQDVLIPVAKAGLYELVLKIPGSGKEYKDHFICSPYHTSYMSVADSITFQIRDFISGKAVRDARIQLFNDEYENLGFLQTNAQGYAGVSTKGKDYRYYETISNTVPNGSFERIFGNRRRQPDTGGSEAAIYTDRGIYRPGQSVYFKGIVFNTDKNGDQSPLCNGKIIISLESDANRKISSQEVSTNSFGSFAGKFILPTATLNKSYRILCSMRQDNQTVFIGRKNFRVEEYKRPELDINLSPAKDYIHFGDTVTQTGMVSSFSGVAVREKPVHYSVTFLPQGGSLKDVVSGMAMTDREGKFSLTFAPQIPKQYLRGFIPFQYCKITASVTDAKGETQESSVFIRLRNPRLRLSVNIPKQINKLLPAEIRFSSSDALQDILPLNVRYVICRQTENDRTVGLDSGLLLAGVPNRLSPAMDKWESGKYTLYVWSPENGREHSVRKDFYLYSPDDKRPPFRMSDWYVEEKTDCRIGEEALILFGSSDTNVYVSCELYSDSALLSREVRTVSDGILHLKIPYRKEYGKCVWSVISAVRNGKHISHTTAINKIEEDKNLRIETITFRDRTTPGSKESWEFRITDSSGRNRVAEMMAVMYDASLDKLVPHNFAFPMRYTFRSCPFRWNPQNHSQSNNSQNRYIFMSNFMGFAGKFSPLAFHLAFNATKAYLPVAESSIFCMVADASTNLAAPTAMKRTSATYQKTQENAADRDMAGRGGRGEQSVRFRSDFQETAFFYPQLVSDSSGTVKIRFTIPESNTRWRFMALAHTQDFMNGTLEKEVVTSKELMVTPNLPRFFRSGDKTTVKTEIRNQGKDRQAGSARLELFDPRTNEILKQAEYPFDVAGQSNQVVGFTFDVPQQVSVIGCRISAGSAAFSDGEQHLVAVLPDRIMVTTTAPITAAGKGDYKFAIQAKDKTEPYRLTLEVTANPLWNVVLALPSLAEASSEDMITLTARWYANAAASFIARSNPRISEFLRSQVAGNGRLQSPLEKNPELKSILTELSPWAEEAKNETEQIQSLGSLLNSRLADSLEKEIMQKILTLQTKNGGWGWYKNGPESRYITLNFLAAMARATITAEKEHSEEVKMAQMKALRYLDQELKKDYADKKSGINYDQLIYLYVRSLYRDVPLGDALSAHKHYVAQAEKKWDKFSLYQKALTAQMLQNYGLTQTAEAIVRSLKEYATVSPQLGMSWANNKAEYYRNSAVSTHVAIMNAIQSIRGNDQDMKLMKQWLLQQKQTQNWGNVPTTADAVYALLLTGSSRLDEQESLTVVSGGQEYELPGKENPLGYFKQSWTAPEIRSEFFQAELKKKNDAPAWGGFYLQYFEDLENVRQESGGIHVDKSLYVERKNNGRAEIIPVEDATLKIGDKIIVRLTVKTDRDMEYMHLQDLRGGCLEPEEQLSDNEWQDRVSYYREVKDAVTNFYFTHLPKGTHVFEYGLWVNQAGEYQAGIATLQCIYAPEFSAHSGSSRLMITE